MHQLYYIIIYIEKKQGVNFIRSDLDSLSRVGFGSGFFVQRSDPGQLQPDPQPWSEGRRDNNPLETLTLVQGYIFLSKDLFLSNLYCVMTHAFLKTEENVLRNVC